MDFSLIERDIYRIPKTEAFALANSYRIKLPLSEDDVTQEQLRTNLALVKRILQAANKDPALKLVLEKLYSNDELSDHDKEKYPILAQYKAILDDHFYETPCPNGASSSTVNASSYENNSVIAHERLLTQRKEFNSQNSLLGDLTDNFEPQNSTNSQPNLMFSPTHLGKSNLNLKQNQPLPLPPHETKTHDFTVKQTVMENIPLIKASTFGALGSESAEEFLNRYNVASRCNKWSDSTKIDLFQTHLTSTPYKWMSMYKMENPGFKWDDLERDFLQTFSPIAQIEDLQSILENRLQNSTETALQFVYEITHLCRRIDPFMSDEKIIHYVLQGINPDFCTQLLSLQNKTLKQLKENIYSIEKRSLMKNKNLQKHSVTNFSHTSVPSSSKSLRFDEENLNSQILANKVKSLEETVAALSVTSTTADRKSRRDSVDGGSTETFRRKFSRSPSSSLDKTDERRQYHSPSASHRTRQHFRSPQRETQENKNNAVFCYICKKSNHSTDNCSFNAKTKPNSYRANKHATMWCDFCKTKTHTYDRCYRKPQNNSRTNKSQPYNNFAHFDNQNNYPSGYQFPMYNRQPRNNQPPFHNPAFYGPYANKQQHPYGYPKNA